MIKGRENKIQSTDLLVCFPSRTHLTLMPKPICSPSRPSEQPNKRPNHHHHHHLKRVNTRASGGSTTGGPNSPWAKNNQMRQEVAEPTSPKVTCAGQIKVRPTSSATCKSWQSVMEEIERIHNRSKNKKKSKWADNFGFKKDVMSFLTCLRNLRFDFRCFGGFPEADLPTSDDEDEDEDDDEFEICDEQNHHHPLQQINDKISDDNNNYNNNNNSAVFSKWFMVLQENQGTEIALVKKEGVLEENEERSPPAVPPPNALLLMRCRSAPAKSWLEEKEDEDRKEEENREVKEESNNNNNNNKKKKKKRDSLEILMKYDTDFYNLSSEISQETWVVDGFKEAFSRSKSSRR